MQNKKQIIFVFLPLFLFLLGNNGVFAQYCIPTYTDSTAYDDYLDGVILGSINNTGTGGMGQAGYVDYTSTVLPTTLSGGTSYTLTVINGGYLGSIAAWIDYDQNGTFDANEKLGQVDNIAAGDTADIIFNVPVSVLTGATVMRVREAYNATLMDPCSNYGYGQAEDYVVDLLGVSYCTPTYVLGTTDGDFIDGVALGSISNLNTGSMGGPDYNDYTNLSTTVLAGSTYTMTLTNNPNYDEVFAAWIDYDQNAVFDATEKIGEISVLAGASGTITFTIPTNVLLGSTRMRVRQAYNEINIDPCLSYDYGETEDYTVEISAYCIPTYTSGTQFDDYLDGVEFGTISNINSGGTGGPSYNDYTATYSTQVNQNGVYPITLTNGGYLGLFAAWIDYNQDGVFDLTEQILLTPDTITAFGTYTTNITIPNTATLGVTRMRVREVYNFGPLALDPCLNYGFGEAEDYTVEILGGAATDLATTAIVSPTVACGTDDYIVRIKNVGTTPIDMANTPIEVDGSVSGPVNNVYPTVTISTGTLGVNDSLDVVLGSITTSAAGTYIFSASSTVSGDGNATNDALVDSLISTPTFTVNYFEDFDGTTPANGWVGQGVSIYAAAAHGNNTAVVGANVYSGNVAPYAVTPKIGAVAATNYLIFDYRIVDYVSPNPATNLQDGDGIVVYVSDDCGQNFTPIYIIDSTTHIATTNMTHVEIPLSACAGSTLMFAFQGIYGGGTSDFYFDIDSVEVRNLTTQNVDDAGVMAINNPITDVCENTIVDVIVTIMNYGTTTLSNIPVSADVTGAASATLSTTYTGTLLPGSTDFVVVGSFTTGAAGMVMIDAYTALAGDADAANDNSMVMFNVVASPVVNLGADDTLCVGQAIVLDAGNAGATYSWSTGGTTQTISAIAPQLVSVTVTNSAGCIGSDDVVLTEIAPIQAMPMNITGTSCNGSADGSASVMANGGTGTYNYSWSNGLNTLTINNVAAGTYSVVVSDGCAADVLVSPIMVTQPSLISANSFVTNVSCNGGANGSISVAINGGTAPYSISWSNNMTGTPISGLGVGTYTGTITDANGCAGGTVSGTITEPTAISNTTTSTNESCPNAADGTASVNVTGGTAPYTISWSNNTTGTPIGGLTAGAYMATITDANGCAGGTASVTITTLGALPVASFTSSVTGVGAVNFTSTSTGATSYSWNFGDNTTSTQQNPAHTYASNGTFTVSLTATNACGSVTTTQQVSITGVAIDNALLSHVSAYPNPVSDVLNVAFNNVNLDNISLAIYDSRGQMVIEKNIGNIAGNLTETINMSSLAKGVYMLAIRQDGNAAYIKIIK